MKTLSPEHKAKMQAGRLFKAQNAQSDNAKTATKTIISADPAGDSLLHPQSQKKLKSMPEHCRNTYRLAMTGKRRNAAIKSACVECMGYNRADVPGCTSHGCPLYPYRPGANR